MYDTEQHLIARNKIAASIGQQIVIDILKEYREKFVSQMKAVIPTANDINAFNLHRALGRVEALDFLISEAERANKPQSNKKDI